MTGGEQMAAAEACNPSIVADSKDSMTSDRIEWD